MILNYLSMRKQNFLAFFLGFYCVYDLAIALSHAWQFTTDDAYISWVYARQLINGQGLLWHGTPAPVEGYSNFLWIILSALIMKLQLPLLASVKWFSIVSLGGGMFFLYRIGRTFFNPLAAMLAVFLFSHYIGVVWWTVSGLESMFYCALSLLLVWQCIRAMGIVSNSAVPWTSHGTVEAPIYSTTSWLLCNISLLLLALTRFEGLVWVIPVAVFMACQIRVRFINKIQPDKSTMYRWLLITLLCFILPYLLYFSWRVYYFGHWIPNSYRCKSLASGQFFVVDQDYLQVLFPFIIAALPFFLLAKKGCWHWLLWLPSVLYAVMLWKADPVITHYLRLFLGPFALFSLLPVLGVMQFIQDFIRLKIDPEVLSAVLIIVMTFLFIPSHNVSFLQKAVLHYQERTHNRMQIVEFLNKEAKSGDTVLLNDCGIIPFSARYDLRFIDMQCLNNPELTQSPYLHRLDLYAEHLQQEIKPAWVITLYYPLESRSDYLTDLLEKNHFFDDYRLVTVLKSGFIPQEHALSSKRTMDFVFYLYKRVDE
ncbi:hypothetical protein [Legionella shakespearei]|uniref:Protein LphB n=1 Tax=Legionella shakespearei DSM 23087 TaxID=1122169 RepID=A0A0W0YSX1_9GAMM|nr:hypothetical protein [Legionella shakespearei]KTD59981.1 protein LphB [Legionella shakespearei DSM 23087]